MMRVHKIAILNLICNNSYSKETPIIPKFSNSNCELFGDYNRFGLSNDRQMIRCLYTKNNLKAVIQKAVKEFMNKCVKH